MLQCLQCVCSAFAVCCSVLRCVAVRSITCTYTHKCVMCVAVRCSMLQCVAACCSVLQCITVCCSVLHVCRSALNHLHLHTYKCFKCVAACLYCVWSACIVWLARVSSSNGGLRPNGYFRDLRSFVDQFQESKRLEGQPNLKSPKKSKLRYIARLDILGGRLYFEIPGPCVGGYYSVTATRFPYYLSLRTISWRSLTGTVIGTNQTQKWVRTPKLEEWVRQPGYRP